MFRAAARQQAGDDGARAGVPRAKVYERIDEGKPAGGRAPSAAEFASLISEATRH